jgi:hypothetical protein
MTYLNNKNKNHLIAAIATFHILAISIILASTSIVTPAAATTTTTMAAEGNTNTTSSVLSSAIKLSSQPIYQERSPPGTETPVNETHGMLTFSGNGTLTLPNSTQTINTTSNGTALISFATFSGYGKETITAANGESATVTSYEIVQFNNPATAPEGGGKGIITTVFQTNSTGVLAPLNGMIAAGIDDIRPNGESHTTLWRWESGIPLPNGSTTGTGESPSSLMNTTTTNAATTTSGTNATTATTGEESVEEEAVGGAEVAE